MKNVQHIGRLAVRLASEAYFGTELLKKCSVYGFNNREALPRDGVMALKDKLIAVFLQYVASPAEFEP